MNARASKKQVIQTGAPA